MLIVNINLKGCETEVAQPIITCGSMGSVRAKFAFDGEWSGLAKTAVFKSECGEVLVPIFNNECNFPPEALRSGTNVKVGVFGTDGERTLTSLYANVKVAHGVSSNGEEATNYTPGLYELFCAKFQRFDNFCATAKKGEEAAVTLVDNGEKVTLEFVLPKGDTPKKGVDYFTEADKKELVDAVIAAVNEHVDLRIGEVENALVSLHEYALSLSGGEE